MTGASQSGQTKKNNPKVLAIEKKRNEAVKSRKRSYAGYGGVKRKE